MSGHPLAIGAIVAGKYRIERVVGEGGMGVVFGARHIHLDETVALKVLRPDVTADAKAVARFHKEARAAVRMKGEHIARVMDVGSLDDGTPYMLMELLQGTDLSTVVQNKAEVPVETAVDYVLQICEALAEAHALGIVHRDIKPSNLFLTTRLDGTPCIKVLDFGIAKVTRPIDPAKPDAGVTQTQSLMGSPQYMAPEQMRARRKVDGRTDIWALGTIMHELLTGSPPFEGANMAELFAMILQDAPPSLLVRRPDVPPELDAIVVRCLAKAPEERPADVHELAMALAPFGSALSGGAAERIGRVRSLVAANASRPPPGPDATRPDLVVKSDPSSADTLAHAHTTLVDEARAQEPRRRSPAKVAAGVALVLGLVTVFAIAFRRGKEDAQRVSTAAEPASAIAVPAPPPSVEPDPAPPPTLAETASSSTSPAPSGSARRDGRPAPRPHPTRASASAASTRPAAPVTPSAAPQRPQPQATASSRYD